VVAREIVEKIYYFIKENPDKTKNQVVNGMKNEYSRLTILEGIDALLDSGKVSFRPKDKAKGFYHLYTNDKNEFNKILNTMIEPLEGWSKDHGCNYLPVNPKQMDKIAPQQLVHYLSFYIGLSLTASKIYDSIESLDDRNTLLLKLVKVLASPNKTQKTLVDEWKETFSEIQGH
jgi:hypothetical protein